MSVWTYQFALVPSDGFHGFPGGIDLLEIDLRPREYFAWLLLETSILGVFASLDMLLSLSSGKLKYPILPDSIWGAGRKNIPR